MEIIQSIILGIIQGITEFLPISSTAHLIIIPWLVKWKDPGLVYSVALHFGSLFAILFYFRDDLKKITLGFFKCLKSGSFDVSKDGRIGFYLIVASIPAVILGLVFESYVSGILRKPVYVSGFLSLFAINNDKTKEVNIIPICINLFRF